MGIEVHQINYNPPIDLEDLIKIADGTNPTAITNDQTQERSILAINYQDGSQKVLRRDHYLRYIPSSTPYTITPPTLEGIQQHVLFVYDTYAVHYVDPTAEELETEHEMNQQELEKATQSFPPDIRRRILTTREANYYSHDAILDPDVINNPLLVHAQLSIKRGRPETEEPTPKPDPSEALTI